ncbi:MAG: MOSC domain-containing protein [Spirochaetales bacterium]|nr:MOSC domain-containing protein [Spirochaetales bacterium]
MIANEGEFTVESLNVSKARGQKKVPVESIALRAGWGIEGDAHAGDWHRQVSLLADEDVDGMRAVLPSIGPGDFAENVTTRGVSVAELPVGARLELGTAVLEVTQIGKECHEGCEIRAIVGDCVMPRRGIFAKVVESGEVRRGDRGRYRF